jgi:hypothetical protein
VDKETEAKQNIIDYHMTFDTEHGKRVLAHMEKLAQFNTTVSPPLGNDGHTDVYRVMYKQGQRCVITNIHSMLKKEFKERKEIKNA